VPAPSDSDSEQPGGRRTLAGPVSKRSLPWGFPPLRAETPGSSFPLVFLYVTPGEKSREGSGVGAERRSRRPGSSVSLRLLAGLGAGRASSAALPGGSGDIKRR